MDVRHYTAADGPSPSLPTLTISEVVAFADALKAAGDAMVGIVNQPRVTERLASVISDRIEAFDMERQRLMDQLRGRQPNDPIERDARAYALIAFECDCGAGIGDIAKLAASLQS